MRQSELQAQIPSSSAPTRFFGSDPNPKQTAAVRQLRRRLETLDDLTATRADLLADARRLAAADDVRPAVLRSATVHDVTAAAFEPLFERELAKYARFEDELSDNAHRQEDELELVRVRRSIYLLDAINQDLAHRLPTRISQKRVRPIHPYKLASGPYKTSTSPITSTESLLPI